jgi:hypothetical protein
MEGSFWWKSHLKLLDTYKAMARYNFGNEKSVLFWTGIWEDTCVYLKFPHLVTFAQITDHSVWEVISQEFLQDMFHLPLSQAGFS